MRVRPPSENVIVPPPAGFELTCQKSYSQPSGSTTVRCPSPPPAGRAALGMRICMPLIAGL